ncbi:hypothetical protein RRF57_012801 [Xylaria bambusicola]|uniref:Uncharacterized protein n=1 Tax=Xylaria bambusicola TaxID=326684 RepID=A0AAN7UYI6_9PEZI
MEPNTPPSKAPDPSLARPEKVESNSGLPGSSRPPLEVLYPGPADPKKVEVDIVAVHGLGSNVDWSWTWQNKKGTRPPVHWLKDDDMLPCVVPHARIIAYNYESRWHAGAPKIRLELCDEELNLDQLILILICLTGFIICRPYQNAQISPAIYNRLCASWDPFRGTKMQNLAKIVARLIAPVGSHDGIIEELQQDGKHLADDVHAFSQLRNKLDISTTCFIELHDSDYRRKVGLDGWARARVVEEESAHIPGWGRAPLYADHFNLNKFDGPNNHSFLSVSNELCRMCANWKSVLEKRKQLP